MYSTILYYSHEKSILPPFLLRLLIPKISSSLPIVVPGKLGEGGLSSALSPPLSPRTNPISQASASHTIESSSRY